MRVRFLTWKARKRLAIQGRDIKGRIESMGIPRMWGLCPEDVLNDTTAWYKHCADCGLSAAPIFAKVGDDPEHTSASEVLLLIDQTLLALDPPAAVGG